MRPDKRVAVLGQGYVGLPLAIRAAEVGYDVVGFDLDGERVRTLRAGRSFVEDVSDDVVRDALATGRYRATADPDQLHGFDVALVAVPTPMRDGTPDLSHIEGAAAHLAKHLRPGALVVLESTSYPGTTQDFLAPILEDGSGLKAGIDFHLGYSPERTDPGNKNFGLVNTPKVVSGVDENSLVAVQAFYATIVDRTVTVSTPKEAELSKLLENTFRHVNIALVNELAVLAHDLGIDIWDTIDAASTKPFGFMRFEPGPGVGGHCLPIDPSYLSWQVRRRLGETFRFVELARDINHTMPHYVVQRITEGLNTRGLPVRGSRILLLGLAYKRNTGDTRESPALVIAQKLLDLGAAVVAAEPHADASRLPAHIEVVNATPEEAAKADAVLLLADHDEFPLDHLAASARYVLDCRRRMRGPTVEYL